jgi:uncharacterized repeat protein (TIGR01451 family)
MLRAAPAETHHRVLAAPMTSLLLLLVLTVTAPAAHAAQSGLYVTFAARVCPTYPDITANRARNDIQESLQNLGADTPYSAGQPVSAATEEQVQPNCRPLPNWTFTLGTGYRTRAVSGPWGSLSIVTGAFSTAVTTQASVPPLDPSGRPTGATLAGATTIELTQQQAQLAARANALWAQGGTPSDPILNATYPGQYGFGALRCAIDNLNGDNVEWISYPSGATHVFCFAYYVQPPPTSGTIVIRKQLIAPAGTAEPFTFGGNLSFNSNGQFTLSPSTSQAAQQEFIRAETLPGDPPWTAQELVPPNWQLTGLSCLSQTQASTATTSLATATASITLAPGDTVTCTYTDTLVPPTGGLLIRKITQGGVGSFGFSVQPSGGGAATTATAQTTAEGEAADAAPGPLNLAPGTYTITETAPSVAGGRWKLVSAQCNGASLAASSGGVLSVTVVAQQSTVCTFTNAFTQLGSIKLAKITRGGLATTGFVVSPESGTPVELRQSATTKHEGVPRTATGDALHDLDLGRWVIQETSPEPVGAGRWELTAVQCNGLDVPFAQGQATVTLSAASATQSCVFTNTHLPSEPPGPVEPADRETATLSVVKHALQSQVSLGQTVAYRIVVTNHGPAEARDVTVDDQPLGSAEFVSATPTQGTCTQAAPTTCLLGAIPSGHHAAITVRLRPQSTGVFENRAVAGLSNADPSYAGDTATASTTVVSLPFFTG